MVGEVCKRTLWATTGHRRQPHLRFLLVPLERLAFLCLDPTYGAPYLAVHHESSGGDRSLIFFQ
jgi:hypothetical protein